jgi:hypothetical protein
VLKTASYRSSLPLEAWAAGLFLFALSAVAWAWLFRMGAAGDIFLRRMGTVTIEKLIGTRAVFLRLSAIALFLGGAVEMTRSMV